MVIYALYLIYCHCSSKQGIVSHRFESVGVFYYSDQNIEEAAEYIGTIIVKPKLREHVINVKSSHFSPGNVTT